MFPKLGLWPFPRACLIDGMRLLFAATAFGAWHWWIYKTPLLASHDLDNWFCTSTIEPLIRAMLELLLLLAATQLYLDCFLRLQAILLRT